MALLGRKPLLNGSVATYFKIIAVHLDINRQFLFIEFAGFQDKDTRDLNWKPGNTSSSAYFKDELWIKGDDFNENIMPRINAAGSVAFAYQLLKDRVDYLNDAQSI